MCGSTKFASDDASSQYSSDEGGSDLDSDGPKSPKNNRRKSLAPFANAVTSDDEHEGGRSSGRECSPVSVTDAINSDVDPLRNQKLIQKIYQAAKSRRPRILIPDEVHKLLKNFYDLCDQDVTTKKLKRQVTQYHNDSKSLIKYVIFLHER